MSLPPEIHDPVPLGSHFERGVRLGVAFPHNVPGLAHGADASIVFTGAVEDLGLSYLTIADHVVGADTSQRPDWSGRYSADDPFHEVFVHLAYLAALTRLELMPAVLVLPQRPTALTAKQAAELSHLARGGLRLGVGLGWNAVEYAALGAEFTNRALRFDEQLMVLRKLWCEPVVTVRSAHHDLDRVAITPRPVARIPLWIGGGNSAAAHATGKIVRRIVDHGDGWISAPGTDTKRWATFAQQLRADAADTGRDPATIGVQLSVNVSPGGGADELRRRLEELHAINPSHLTLDTRSGQRSADQHIDDLAAAIDIARGCMEIADAY
jgi:probable F420-dependent oxidoreductase